MIILTLIFSTYTSNYIFSIIVAILWIISPFLAWYISREKEDKVNIQEQQKDFLLNVAKDTWEYFNRYLIEENNYLIPDNYQENREPIIVQRTSSTNIGLSLIAVMSAYDLKFIEQDRAKQMITNILDTIDKLKKYRGNIYNWYDIKTLEPLNDSISSVDNGNYIGYLYVLEKSRRSSSTPPSESSKLLAWGIIPSSHPQINTTGNSKPFAECIVIITTASSPSL